MSQFPPRHARRPGASPTKRGPATSHSLIARSGIIALMVACGVAVSDLAEAQQPPAQQSPAQGAPQQPAQQDPPVLLNADTVTFDQDLGLVTASGNVELSQGARSVRADTITYNQKTKVVTATGNVRLVEPSGDILFSNYAELTDDLKNLFVENIRVLMTDNSRMAGTEGERREGRLIRMNRAVYSPCELCKEDPTRAPVWQLRAARVVQDNEEHEVRYRDAVMEMFGVPFFYLPYLSHPDPTVDRKSGFLTPSFRNSSELGFGIVSHYYWDIAPDKDATIDFGGYTQQGPYVGGQYRQRFEKGSLQLDGSLTEGEIPNGSVSGANDRRLRGHFFSRGRFEIDDTWRWGFDVKRASDDYYLRRFFNNRDEVLTSRGFIEGFNGRNYAVANTYSFQDLRYGNTVPEPYVLPDARYLAFGEPGSFLGGRWSLNSSLLGVNRIGKDGPNTRRIAVIPGWEREFVSNAGFVTTLSGSVLVAGYSADQFNPVEPTSPGNNSISRLRFFPQAQATVRYPFVRYGESSQQLIEPIGQLTVAPNVGDHTAYPNEDSLDVEFDEVNLFMPNRFTGIDRLDGGSRFTYGLRSSITGYKTGSASVFLGQSIRFSKSNQFQSGSGLEDQRSDYVGRVDLRPANWMDINYGFRIDHDTLDPLRHSVNAAVGVPELTLSTAYTYIDQTQSRYAIQKDIVEQASFGLSSKFTDNWSINLAHLQAMRPQPGARSSAAILRYQDECLIFETIAQRDYTTTASGQTDGNTLFFRFVFKNIGEFRTPGFSSSFLGATNSNNSAR
ncbi:LPS-assembly protein LptD [Azospirillum rugosum]|uniref:LPS-assembly protein LptD n=1 Tax=Azospirillum rugosum TaxID=416170 RepID=A0ABS4SDD6_9PROT|nr:LPS assembly protein LptD [Azospirillum rugosum]MBP2290596.1 LPS-assembly protein [Azospirillum rugosum]MDQ0525484.1 LPS-assembly protein [Azospirillum rugosum]